MKTCSKCKETKEFSEFFKQKSTKDGLSPACKSCESKRRKELKINPTMQLNKIVRSSVLIENKILKRENKKLCRCCKNIFNISDMNQGVVCLPCKREIGKKSRESEKGNLSKKIQDKRYYEKNKKKIALKTKEYREKNKEEIANKKNEYYLKNIEKKKEYDRQYRLKKKLEKQNNT